MPTKLLKLKAVFQNLCGMQFPWQPIFTVARSGQPEITVSGIVSVISGSSSQNSCIIFGLGDVHYRMWTRSLLKPWQLLSHLDIIMAAYPQLRGEHLAIMASSHSAEEQHLRVLDEIVSLTGLDRDLLQCPSSYPLSAAAQWRLRNSQSPPSRLYHDCSGKHMGYILSALAQGFNANEYLSLNNPDTKRLKTMLAWLVGRLEEDISDTTDGCQLSNQSLSGLEIATLYHGLASGTTPALRGDASIDKALSLYGTVNSLIRSFPQLIGGTDRLDSTLMQAACQSGFFRDNQTPGLIAKEGADGLLAVGIGSTKQYPDGLGILIKSSAGYEPRYTRVIVHEILYRLGLREKGAEMVEQRPGCRTDHLRLNFHFDSQPLPTHNSMSNERSLLNALARSLPNTSSFMRV